LDLTDTAGIINIGGVDYNYTQRMMDVDTIPALYTALGDNSGHNTVVISAYSGGAGTVTGVPSGSSVGKETSFAAYTTGNKYVDVTSTFAIGDANYAGGIKALSVSGPWHKYQLDFSTNPIMKTSGQQMTVRFRLSWDRYAP